MSTRISKIYSITMPPELGKQAKQMAKEESRSMSELMREAFRRYQIEKAERQVFADPMRLKRLAKFKRIIDELRQEAKQKGLDKMTMREINAEVGALRSARGRKKK
jgi:predicted DNA-binding protein